jgi:hypothetical protein
LEPADGITSYICYPCQPVPYTDIWLVPFTHHTTSPFKDQTEAPFPSFLSVSPLQTMFTILFALIQFLSHLDWPIPRPVFCMQFTLHRLKRHKKWQTHFPQYIQFRYHISLLHSYYTFQSLHVFLFLVLAADLSQQL